MWTKPSQSLNRFFLFLILAWLGAGDCSHADWIRHTIDNTSHGADGIRIGDQNRDGLPDLVTGWEEGGEVRVYFNPGPANVKKNWPRQTVGKVRSPEDAVFADLDRDGHWDVVSCCEGKTKSVYFHFAPSGPGRNWKTVVVPALEGKALWMFAMPMNVDGRFGDDLVIAAKGAEATIGWLEAPENPRVVEDWTWHPLHPVGWVMSIMKQDMNGDRLPDILFSDRKGARRGIHWLEHPGTTHADRTWKRHTIGATDREVMFLALGDINGDQLIDVAANIKGGDLVWCERLNPSGFAWKEHKIPQPKEIGTGKGVAIHDINSDGHPDLLFTCENANGKHGVGWLDAGNRWEMTRISGDQEGVKFDLIQLLDLDADGDL
ncbi:MAG: VCBS repeat-containing protein, partial [Planctomycetaceae bacterium]|nr:VCBS repeat-containing protein [Planctomycetaceae bacterium]